MKVDFKKLPGNLAELAVEVSVAELQPYLMQASERISRELKIPGFRPGKVPYDVLKERIGEIEIYKEAAELVVQKTYPQAVLDQKLETVSSPKIQILKLAPNNPLVYMATVPLLPKIKIKEYKRLKASRKEVKVAEEEINKAIGSLQKMYGKEILVTRPAKKGDKVEVDFDVFVDRVAIDSGTSKKHPLVIGEGQFIPGFEENLIGLAETQTKEFELKFPKEYHQKNLAGKLAQFKIKMGRVYEVNLPALDDQFAKQLGKFEKFEEVRKLIEKNLLDEAKTKEEQRLELEILDEIIKNSEFEELPVALVEAETEKMVGEFKEEVARSGMKFEDYLVSIKKTLEELKKEIKPQAERRLKTALIFREVARAEGINVSEAEITAEIEKSLEKAKNNPDFENQIKSSDYRIYLANILTSQKVLAFLKNLIKDK